MQSHVCIRAKIDSICSYGISIIIFFDLIYLFYVISVMEYAFDLFIGIAQKGIAAVKKHLDFSVRLLTAHKCDHHSVFSPFHCIICRTKLSSVISYILTSGDFSSPTSVSFHDISYFKSRSSTIRVRKIDPSTHKKILTAFFIIGLNLLIVCTLRNTLQ